MRPPLSPHPADVAFCKPSERLTHSVLLPRCVPDSLQLVGPSSITVLHAAVIGGAPAVLPLLVAAGAELDTAMELCPASNLARDFVASLGGRRGGWHDGTTALGMAVG